MSATKQKKTLIFLSKVILIALLIVFLVRTFLIESYTISSSQMQTAIEEGDYVLVDKTAYGIRIPITILSVPFTFDTFFGRKSYSSLFALPYKRVFEKPLQHNDVVLFNNPNESDKPIDKRELLLSRCIALPGDTIEIINDTYLIEHKDYIFSPDYMEEYKYLSSHESIIEETADEQEIPLRNKKPCDSDTTSIVLNKYEAFIMNEVLPDSVSVWRKEAEPIDYKFVVPRKDQIIQLTERNMAIYKQVILFEQGSKARFVNDKLVIDGNSQEYYTFLENYYWLLSDNKNNSIDSRSIGFIPFSHIIGKANYIWYSSANGSVRKDRLFVPVK